MNCPNSRDFVNREDTPFGDIFTFVSPSGDELGSFNDSSHVECPEDLIFSRDIGSIFDIGFRIGYEVGLQQEQEV